jgi:hypothetical protein
MLIAVLYISRVSTWLGMHKHHHYADVSASSTKSRHAAGSKQVMLYRLKQVFHNT